MVLNESLTYVVMGCAVVALVYAFILSKWIMSRPAGDEKMQKLARAVQSGAMAFLKTEYSRLAIFAGIVIVALYIWVTPKYRGRRLRVRQSAV